jgi:hypothetical protein
VIARSSIVSASRLGHEVEAECPCGALPLGRVDRHSENIVDNVHVLF